MNRHSSCAFTDYPVCDKSPQQMLSEAGFPLVVRVRWKKSDFEIVSEFLANTDISERSLSYWSVGCGGEWLYWLPQMGAIV
ncbi:hypothetical protein NPIL_286841 [Nephila pilipes]|uniref:Uncharacterized protein n=1 Tax=Nephila pilipes TaxID=299642 RepID=A0A8X6QJW2_NEPPI|nr:hypothetical protein NPIL_286841 [Nephila pilipes]